MIECALIVFDQHETDGLTQFAGALRFILLCVILCSLPPSLSLSVHTNPCVSVYLHCQLNFDNDNGNVHWTFCNVRLYVAVHLPSDSFIFLFVPFGGGGFCISHMQQEIV